MNHRGFHSVSVSAESADLGQFGKTRDLYTPTFIFGCVEEKAIQLVERHYIEYPLDRLSTLKISGNVNVEATIFEPRSIFDRNNRKDHFL